MVDPINFGGYFRELRLSRDLTLRAYCAESGEDPGYISRLERGLIEPPKDAEVLDRLARSLRLPAESPARKEFDRLAAIGAGRIPKDIMEDKELVKHLPVLFRTISGEKFPDEKLDDLIAYIRALNTPGQTEKDNTEPLKE